MITNSRDLETVRRLIAALETALVEINRPLFGPIPASGLKGIIDNLRDEITQYETSLPLSIAFKWDRVATTTLVFNSRALDAYDCRIDVDNDPDNGVGYYWKVNGRAADADSWQENRGRTLSFDAAERAIRDEIFKRRAK